MPVTLRWLKHTQNVETQRQSFAIHISDAGLLSLVVLTSA